MKNYYTKHKPKDILKIDKLVTIHYNQFSDTFNFPGESHDFWEMVYADKGTAHIRMQDKEFLLPQGHVVFHKPNEFHAISADKDEPPNVVVITFSTRSPSVCFFEDFTTELPKALRFHITEIFENAIKTFILPMRKGRLEMLSSPVLGGEQMIKTHLEQLLIELMRNSTDNAFSKYRAVDDNSTVAECICFLEENVCKTLSINDICAKTNYSRTYICTLFKAVTGKTIIQYYNELKIDEAKKLIRKNKYTFSEIAEILGFNTPTYFTHTFSKIAKMTPSQYKKSIIH